MFQNVSLNKRKRRTNTSRLFCKTQPGLVLTSVDAGLVGGSGREGTEGSVGGQREEGGM